MLHIINETINTYFIYSSFSFAYFIKKISIKKPDLYFTDEAKCN